MLYENRITSFLNDFQIINSYFYFCHGINLVGGGIYINNINSICFLNNNLFYSCFSSGNENIGRRGSCSGGGFLIYSKISIYSFLCFFNCSSNAYGGGFYSQSSPSFNQNLNFSTFSLCNSNAVASFGFDESNTLIFNVNSTNSFSKDDIIHIGYQPRSNKISFLLINNGISGCCLGLEASGTNAYCYNSNFINNSIKNTFAYSGVITNYWSTNYIINSTFINNIGTFVYLYSSTLHFINCYSNNNQITSNGIIFLSENQIITNQIIEYCFLTKYTKIKNSLSNFFLIVLFNPIIYLYY